MPPIVDAPRPPPVLDGEAIVQYLKSLGLLKGSADALAAVAKTQSLEKLTQLATINGVGGLLRQAEDGGNKRADDHPRTFIELTPRRRRVGRVLVLRFIGYCACSEGEIFSPSPPSRRGPSSLIALPPLPRAQATRKARCSS